MHVGASQGDLAAVDPFSSGENGLAAFAVFLGIQQPLCAADHPLGLDPNIPYGQLSSEIVTPHISWARPLASGTIRGLVMAPTWSHRETVELAQRLDFEYVPWMCASYDRMADPPSTDFAQKHFSISPETIETALRKALEGTYDVFVIGRLDWSILTAGSAEEILRRVEDGAGLVYVSPLNPDHVPKQLAAHPSAAGRQLLTGVPLSALPRLAGADPDRLVRTGRHGTGRVVVLDYQEPPLRRTHDGMQHCLSPEWVHSFGERAWPDAAEVEAEIVQYDYYMSLVARCVAWAAGWSPSIANATVSTPSEGAATLTLQGAEGLSSTGAVRLAIANPYGEVVHSEMFAPAGLATNAPITLPLPDLPAGRHFCNYWLLSSLDKAILDWGTALVDVPAPVTIAGLSPDRRAIEPGDAFEVIVRLSQPLPDGHSLSVELHDDHGRLLATRSPPCDGTTATAAYTLPADPLTCIHTLRAAVTRSNALVCASRAAFPVQKRRDFHEFELIASAGGHNTYPNHLCLKKLKEDGFDAVYVTVATHELRRRGEANAPEFTIEEELEENFNSATTANLAPILHTGQIGRFKGDERHCSTSFCISDPVFRELLRASSGSDVALGKRYGVAGYAHGDEAMYGNDPDVCWCAHCMRRFRAYLRDDYGSLDSLNHTWQSSFDAWDDVMPIALEEAVETGRFAPWVDHKLFNIEIYHEMYRRIRDVIHAVDPGVPTGPMSMGLQVFANSGYDLSRIWREVGYAQSYANATLETTAIDAFAANERQVRGSWFGAYGTGANGPSNARYVQYFLWDSILRLRNSAWFWKIGFTEPRQASGPAAYTPDLRPLPYFAAALEHVRKIKGGVGKLLLHSRTAPSEVAAYYSPLGHIMGTLLTEDVNRRFESRLVRPHDGKTDFYWQSEYYVRHFADVIKATEDLGLRCSLVSADQFVAGGPAASGMKLLVMPQVHALSDAEAEAVRRWVHAGGVLVADVIPGAYDEHGRRRPAPALAELFGNGKPMELTARGDGKTLLFDDLLFGYVPKWSAHRPWKDVRRREILDQWRSILEVQRGVVSPVRLIAAAEHQDLPPPRIHRLESGETRFVGLLRDFFVEDEDVYPATLALGAESRHVYDLLSGAYLGLTNRVDISWSEAPRIFACVPYRVSAVRVEVRPPDTPHSTVLSLAIATEDETVPGTHCLHIEICGPQGTPLPHYSRNVIAETGSAVFRQSWAMNEQPGAYRISVTDVTSGQHASCTVTIP